MVKLMCMFFPFQDNHLSMSQTEILMVNMVLSGARVSGVRLRYFFKKMMIQAVIMKLHVTMVKIPNVCILLVRQYTFLIGVILNQLMKPGWLLI
jgi:hypothetical protein